MPLWRHHADSSVETWRTLADVRRGQPAAPMHEAVRLEAWHWRETCFRLARDNAVEMFYWSDRDMGYALSGTIDHVEM